MNSKFKYLSKNILLFSISTFATKILAFLMVPLYTRVLTTQEYGTIDLLQSTVQLLLPIITLNIAESVMRFSFDEDNLEKTFTKGSILTIKGTLVLSLITLMFHFIFPKIFLLEYIFILTLLVFLNGIYNLYVNFLRAIDKVQNIVIASIIYSAVMMGVNVIVLVIFHLGIIGYFFSMIIGYFIAIIYLEVSTSAFRLFFKPSVQDKKLGKAMTNYSIPTVLTNISWWINSSSDRYIVTWLLGVSENGIYSISNKIPSIFSMVHGVFSQAWNISAIKEFGAKDRDKFYQTTYSYYSFVTVFIAMVIILFNKLICFILFSQEFYSAWRYAPLLVVAAVFSAFNGFTGGIFGAIKRTKILAFSTGLSALSNIICNFIFIPSMGAVGAALATAISYIFSWILRIIILQRNNCKLQLNWLKENITYVLLFIQAVLASLENSYYVIQIFIIVLSIIFHKTIIASIFTKIVKYKNQKMGY